MWRFYPSLKISRMSISKQRGRLALLDMHHLGATAEGVRHFVERHELFLFTHREYLAAFEGAGLKVEWDEEGLTGRGLYLAHA